MFVNEKYLLHYKVSVYFSLNIVKLEEVIMDNIYTAGKWK